MGIAKAALESSVRYLARDCGEHGIRVNAISAGPIRTASAAGVKGMGDMLNQLSQTTPLKGCISTKQVGQVATFLASDLSSCITGEVIFADNGYHMMGGACLQ